MCIRDRDRGFKDLSIFEIGPVFFGSSPGEQTTVVCGLSAGKKSRLSWIDKERNVDVFDVKRDVVQTLIEAGYNSDKFFIDDKTPNYYHPGKSGRIFLNKDKDKVAAKTVNYDSVVLCSKLSSSDQLIIYPCTNSGYGIGQEGIYCDENSVLNPISLYGKMKVQAEKVLLDKGIPFAEWNMVDKTINLFIPPPEGIFFNRMSASSHSRGNRYCPELTTGLISWLK